MKCKLRPIDDHVVIRRDEAEGQSRGGILIPDSAKEKPKQGTVVAVGPGKMGPDGKRTPVGVEVGQKVLFLAYHGNEVEVDGQQFLIVGEAAVLATLSE